MSSTDFLHELADPIGWLTELLSNFLEYGYDPQTCTIRTGKKGKRFRNYKIEEESFRITSPIETTVTLGRTSNGRYHGEMTWLEDRYRHDENWSQPITFRDLKSALIVFSGSMLIN